MSLDSAAILANGLFFVEHYLALIVAAIVACAIGTRILGSRLTFKSTLESVCFATAVGLAALSFLILLIGQLRLLYRSLLLISLLICLAISYPVLVSWLRQLKKFDLQERAGALRLALGAGLICVVSLPFLVFPLYPAKDWDATMYHLAAPRIYIKEHAVVFTPYLRYPVFPQTNQMLFTGALLIYDEQFAQLTQFLMLIVMCGAMIAFGKRHLTSRAGWWGAAFFLASPMVLLLGSIAYVDIGLTLICFLCCYALWNWYETRLEAWIVLTGVFGGLAFGAKYTGAFFPLIFFVILLWTERRRKNLRTPGLLALTTFLVASPWLVRSIYFTGNPVFPFLETFFTGIFGQRQIDPVWFQHQVGASLYVGTGRSLLSLLKLPWSMAFDNAAFLPEAPLSTVAVWLLPLTVFCAFRSLHVRWLLVLGVAYTIFWFFGYQFVRYLLPAFPLYCLATAASVDWLLANGRVPSWPGQRALTAALCAALIYPSWYYVAQHVRWEGPLPTTRDERDRYLSARMSSYPAYQFLNAQAGNDYRLYALDDVRMAYFADGTFMGDNFGEANYARIRAKMVSGESLYDELKALGVTHLLFNAEAERTMLPQDDFFARNFRLTFAGNKTRVFELSDQKP